MEPAQSTLNEVQFKFIGVLPGPGPWHFIRLGRAVYAIAKDHSPMLITEQSVEPVKLMMSEPNASPR